MVEKLVPYRFIKIWAKLISGSEAWNVIKFVFVVCPNWGLPNYSKFKVFVTCFHFKAFVKIKKRSKTSLPVSFFCLIFEEKYLSHVLLIDPISLHDWFCFQRYWQYLYCSYLVSSLWSQINLSLPFFCITKKPGQQYKHLKNENGF